MKLPFGREAFLEVFRDYNDALWPLQLALLALGFAALLAAWRGRGSAGRVISLILTLVWVWAGVVYHLVFFRPVNPAASLFAVLFVAGGAGILWEGVVRGRLRFAVPGDLRGAVAIGLAVYALAAYPLLAFATGRSAGEIASFGLPCPTVIFTVGLLGLAKPPVWRGLYVAPILWSLIGAQAAWQFGIVEDFALLLAAAVGVWFALPPQSHARPA